MTRRLLDEPFTPLWVKVYIAVCAIAGIGFLAVLVWALVAIVLKVTRG